MQKNKLIIALIIFLAASLRFYHLGQNPPSLNWDETAHGFNAYSILKTGKDEFGYRFPLSFRSFDDYKPPIYTYLVVPSVLIFDLNDFAVRFPSAAMGTLAVLFTYLMVFELLKNKKIALMAAFLLAVSPWHLQFSRVAFETNSAIFLSVFGTWAFLKGTRQSGFKITLWMSLSSLIYAANLFMYHNARVFIPIFSLILLFLFRKKMWEAKKYLILPVLIALAASLILLPIIFSPAGQARYQGTTIFEDASPQFKASEKIEVDQQSGQLQVGRIIHNRRFVYIPILIANYLSHFNPSYLFFDADMDRHHAPLIGLVYMWSIPFLLIGIFALIRGEFDFKSKIIIFLWFLLAPVASSVTWGTPHSLRSEILLPTFQIFAAIGVYSLFRLVKSKTPYLLVIAFLFVINFAFYIHQYYVHLPREFSEAWLYGRKEAAIYTNNIKENYDRVIVSISLEQPHEFWLYYLKYDPEKYLAEGGTISGGYLEDRNRFDKFLFRPIDYPKQRNEAKTLFVGLPSERPREADLKKEINYLNGEPAIQIFE